MENNPIDQYNYSGKIILKNSNSNDCFDYNIGFSVISVDKIEKLYSWLQDEDIKKRYNDGELSLEEYRNKILKKLSSKNEFPYIINLDGKDVGYIQCYECLKADASWDGIAQEGTRGVDLFLSKNSDYIKGAGAMILKEFVNNVAIGIHNAESVIIDPEESNSRALKAFEKAGFIDTGKRLHGLVIMKYNDFN